MTTTSWGASHKSGQVSRLQQRSIQTSAFTFPSVCLPGNMSLVFPIWKTCLLLFGPHCSCQCKSGRILGPIDTDVRKDSLCAPLGLINDRSLLLQRVSRCAGRTAMNCKCETTDLPAMQTPWCIIAHLGICAYCTKQGLTARNQNTASALKTDMWSADLEYSSWFSFHCKSVFAALTAEGTHIFISQQEFVLNFHSAMQRVMGTQCYFFSLAPCLPQVFKVQSGTRCALTWSRWAWC